MVVRVAVHNSIVSSFAVLIRRTSMMVFLARSIAVVMIVAASAVPSSRVTLGICSCSACCTKQCFYSTSWLTTYFGLMAFMNSRPNMRWVMATSSKLRLKFIPCLMSSALIRDNTSSHLLSSSSAL